VIAQVAYRTGIGFDELLRHPDLLEELIDVLHDADEQSEFARRSAELKAKLG
jgi:hypothetical protein